jgi:hypothetical protein
LMPLGGAAEPRVSGDGDAAASAGVDAGMVVAIGRGVAGTTGVAMGVAVGTGVAPGEAMGTGEAPATGVATTGVAAADVAVDARAAAGSRGRSSHMLTSLPGSGNRFSDTTTCGAFASMTMPQAVCAVSGLPCLATRLPVIVPLTPRKTRIP